MRKKQYRSQGNSNQEADIQSEECEMSTLSSTYFIHF